MTARRAPFVYRAFGLTVRSDLRLPELIPVPDAGAADVTITTVDVMPEPAATLVEVTPTVQAGARDFHLDVPDVARFRVRDGRSIAVLGHAGHDPAALRAYLLGTCIGVILLQRGLVPLHASAVDIGGRAIAFTGRSGAGKSTLALQAARRGHAVLCDDLCGIGADACLSPGVVRLKLWRASLAHAGQDEAGLERIPLGADKFHLPPAMPASDRVVPLAAIVALAWDEADVTVARLAGAKAAQTLVENTFRGILIDPMGIAAPHLLRCAVLAQRVPVLRLSRPHRFDTLDAALDAVIAALD